MGRRPRIPAAFRRSTRAIFPSDSVCPTTRSASSRSSPSMRSPSVSSSRSRGTSDSSETTPATSLIVTRPEDTRPSARRRTRAPARSSTLMALSGSARPGR